MSLRSAKGAVRVGWVAAAPARARSGASVKGRRAPAAGWATRSSAVLPGGVSRARHILALPSPALAGRGEADGVHFKVSSRALAGAAAGKWGAGALLRRWASGGTRLFPATGPRAPMPQDWCGPSFLRKSPRGRGASLCGALAGENGLVIWRGNRAVGHRQTKGDWNARQGIG